MGTQIPFTKFKKLCYAGLSFIFSACKCSRLILFYFLTWMDAHSDKHNKLMNEKGYITKLKKGGTSNEGIRVMGR